MLHVVLFRPLIPANTGNIGRTCLGFGARLHLIKPLGFDLSEREVKRAGLDHWNHVDLTVHDSWRSFTESTLPMLGHDSDGSNKTSRDKMSKITNVYLVSKRLKLGSCPIADVDFFPRRHPPQPPPPPPPSLPTPTTRVGTANDPRRRVDGGGSAPDSSGNTDSSGEVGVGAPPLSSATCGGNSGGGTDSGGDGGGSFGNDVALVFGNEVDGLSGLDEGETGRALPAVYLPMRDDVIRSYNLSNAVAMAVYEVDRQRRESRRRPRGGSADGTA
ncbi:unnamed protein product [Pylaiella littoralis]